MNNREPRPDPDLMGARISRPMSWRPAGDEADLMAPGGERPEETRDGEDRETRSDPDGR
jgi:hypothetical protein